MHKSDVSLWVYLSLILYEKAPTKIRCHRLRAFFGEQKIFLIRGAWLLQGVNKLGRNEIDHVRLIGSKF